jgi:AraC-like DNA-binding protein
MAMALEESSEMAVQRDPVREWREHYARYCLHLDFAPLEDASFRALVTPIFKELPIVRTELSPGVVFRDKDLVRDGDNNLGFLISQSRDLDNTHQGHEVRLGLGDATMMQANEPGRVGSSESFGFFEVMIPPAEWDARGARPVDALMQRFWGKSDAMQLLRGYIRSLEKMGLGASFDGPEIVRRHIIDLVVLAATPHRPVGESSASAVVAARLAAAFDRITSSFQNPELSLATVASDLRISQRYLQRLLETSGTSFTACVNELRLQRAFALLTEARDGERRISDIALQVGFSDISHFNRLFRSRFGDTPRGVRGQRRQ